MKEEKRKAPKLRFPGFDGDWEQRKFGDVGSVSMCKRIFKEETSPDGEIPFYKIGTFGAEPDAYISRELYEDYRAKFAFPEKGDILLSASGTIGRIVEYNGEDAYFQDSNIVWLSHDKTISNKFLKVLYPTVQWDGIEGSTIKRLYNDNFLRTQFSMPKIEEQEQLGSFFSDLDKIITLHQRKLDQIKEYKKGMLQKMFPKKGETVPEVRFPGFEGDWEEKKLGCLTDFVTGKAFSANLSDNGSFIVMDMGTVSQEGNRLEKKTTDIKRDVLRKNDLIMPKDDIGGGLIIGKTAYIPKDNQYVLGDHVYRLRFVHDNGLFFHYQINSDSVRKQILPLVTGSAQLGLNSKNIQGVMVHVPSLNEQVIIGKFFKNLDFLITLQQHKINEMKEYKKGILQQMFV